jgi:DNA-binding transcriptional MerR regulator
MWVGALHSGAVQWASGGASGRFDPARSPLKAGEFMSTFRSAGSQQGPHGPLLTIGKFSILVGLSARMLRFYELQRLLEPACIDPHSSYRYYHPDQFTRAVYIRLLRNLDMPLKDIRRFLEEPDLHTAALHLGEHRARIAEKMVVYAHSLEVLRSMETRPGQLYPVQQVTVPAQASLCLRFCIPIYRKDQTRTFALGRLREELARMGVHAAGPCFSVTDLPRAASPLEASRLELQGDPFEERPHIFGVPMAMFTEAPPGFELCWTEAHTALSTLNVGGFEPIHLALQSLFRHASEVDLRLGTRYREVYWTSPLDTPHKEHYRTEVQMVLADEAQSPE